MKQEIKEYFESQTAKTRQEIHMAEFGKKLAVCLFIIISFGLIAGIIGVVTTLI